MATAGTSVAGHWQAPRTHCSLCSSQARVPERRFPWGSALVMTLPLSHQTGLGDEGGAAKSGLLQQERVPRGQPGPGRLWLAQGPRSRECGSARCAESTPLTKVTPPLETENARTLDPRERLTLWKDQISEASFEI